MFRIQCFCDDARLAKVLWLLATGGVYDVTSEPVMNAKVEKGEVRARVTNGNKLEMLENYLRKLGLRIISPEILQEFCRKNGLQPKSYSNFLRAGVQSGLLERIGEEYRYRVSFSKPTKRKRKHKPRLTDDATPAEKEAA